MFNKKYKLEIDKLKKMNVGLQANVDSYKSLYREAVEEITKLKKQKLTKAIQEYDFAVLFKRYDFTNDIIFWNDGRYEPNVKQVNIYLDAEKNIPSVEIVK